MLGWGAAVEESSSRAIRREVNSVAYLLSNGRRAGTEIAAALVGGILLFLTQEMGGARPGGE